MSHSNSIITPETPPIDEIPKVHIFTGICTVIYLPIKFTANNAQIPCKTVNKSAVKNLFDLKYEIKITIKYIASRTPRKILAEFILSLPKLFWTYYFYYFNA